MCFLRISDHGITARIGQILDSNLVAVIAPIVFLMILTSFLLLPLLALTWLIYSIELTLGSFSVLTFGSLASSY